MTSIDDSSHLRDQYKTASNLDSRANLHARFSTNSEGWFEWLFAHLGISEGSEILEAGCGAGEFWKANQERLMPDWRLTLTDLSPGMVEAASRNTAELKTAIELRVADIQNLPFADNQFDVAVANHMLYHVADLNLALGEVCRVLRRSSVLYCATNGPRHMKELPDFIEEFTAYL
jgi:ubiquinone/menaquinone biosynthesis C-methylase UbiE